MPDDHHALIRDLELALMSSRVRSDPAQTAALLHDDFYEIGRSGVLWTRDAIIGALAHESAHPTPATADWTFSEPAPGLMLVSYRTLGAGASRRTSLWDLSGQPRLRFHQGTPAPSAD